MPAPNEAPKGGNGAGHVDHSPVWRAVQSLARQLGYAEAIAGKLSDGWSFRASLQAIGELAGEDDAESAAIQGEMRGRELARKGEEPWPLLGELPSPPGVPSLSPDLIPEPLRVWLEDIARASCLALELLAVPALVGISSLIGRHGQIQPDPTNRWKATPNLWGAIVARPGTMKSGALAAALQPLGAIAAEAHEDYEADRRRGEAHVIATKARLSAMSKQKNPDETEIAQLLSEIESSQVHERRYRTNDSTTEKLGELLRENPRGLMLVRDELSGWLRTLEKQGREGDREFWLEAWDGGGAWTQDRIGRGTVHIPSLTMSVVGCFQPGKLEQYRDAALAGGIGDDGLLQRFQLLVWPDSTPAWERPTAPPRSGARDRAFEIWRRVDLAYREPREPAVFARDAQALHNEWRDQLEARLRGDETRGAPAFEAHLSKYRGLMPSLALVFHAIDCAAMPSILNPGLVTRSSTRLAIQWCEYLEHHARKLYAPEFGSGRDPAVVIAGKIMDGAVVDGQSVRDLYRTGWAGVRSQAAAEAGLQELERLGWIRLQSVATGGRSSQVVRLNPAVTVRV